MQGDNGSDHRAGNTHFDHFSASGGSVFFKKPDRVLICDPKFVNASGFPSNDWFALAATAEARSRVSAHRCQRTALKDDGEQATVALPNAAVGCQAFTREGGGVVVDVAIPLRKH